MGKAAKNGFNPKVFVAKVGTGKTISKYHKDQVIFAQGDIADTTFYIQKGRVKIVVVSDQGKEAVVAVLEPDQFFSEGCLNGQSIRIATATAMEECLITSITKTAMMTVLESEPKFSRMFMAHLLTRNRPRVTALPSDAPDFREGPSWSIKSSSTRLKASRKAGDAKFRFE